MKELIISYKNKQDLRDTLKREWKKISRELDINPLDTEIDAIIENIEINKEINYREIEDQIKSPWATKSYIGTRLRNSGKFIKKKIYGNVVYLKIKE